MPFSSSPCRYTSLRYGMFTAATMPLLLMFTLNGAAMPRREIQDDMLLILSARDTLIAAREFVCRARAESERAALLRVLRLTPR